MWSDGQYCVRNSQCALWWSPGAEMHPLKLKKVIAFCQDWRFIHQMCEPPWFCQLFNSAAQLTYPRSLQSDDHIGTVDLCSTCSHIYECRSRGKVHTRWVRSILGAWHCFFLRNIGYKRTVVGGCTMFVECDNSHPIFSGDRPEWPQWKLISWSTTLQHITHFLLLLFFPDFWSDLKLLMLFLPPIVLCSSACSFFSSCNWGSFFFSLLFFKNWL